MLGQERPVSIMLIANQESAKTEILKSFSGTRTMVYLSDLTSHGLKPFKTDIEAGRIRHLVLLDLVRIVSHGKATSERTLQTLAALMEEGESKTADAGSVTDWKKFPKIGVMMGITTEYFFSRRAHWRKTGFLTRFVPVSWKYTENTVRKIHENIAHEKSSVGRQIAENLPDLPCFVKLDSKLADELGFQSRRLGMEMKTHGFRYHRVLRAMARAHALQNGSGVVRHKDVDKVIEWTKFLTLKEVEL